MDVFYWLMACGASFEADMRLVCEAPTRPELQSDDPSQRAVNIAEYLNKNLSNAEVIELFENAPLMDPPTRAEVFGRATKRAGIERCAFIEP